MKAVPSMFSFSRCVGRRHKVDPQQPNQLDQKSSSPDAAEAPEPGSEHSDSTKVTSEIKPKLDNFERKITTPISLKSPGKKSYCSSVISRSSASMSQFCAGLNPMEPAQPVNDCRLSIDLEWQTPLTNSKMSSGPLNLQIKCSEFSLDRSLIIHEEGEDPSFARRPSYSDDPFAPPTPRIAMCIPRHRRDSGTDSDIIRASPLAARSHPIDDQETSTDLAMTQPQLPCIARVSKLSFGDWILESPEKSPVLFSRSRLPSTTNRRSTLTSPVPTYRTVMGTNVTNSPRKAYTLSSSTTRGLNRIPFPEFS